MSVRLPRLLDSQMEEVARLAPTQLSLEWTLAPLSLAEMLLPRGERQVTCGDWVELYTPDESAGIFRVTAVETELGWGGGQRVWLEHGLGALADHVIVGAHGCFGLSGEVASGAFINAAVVLRVSASTSGAAVATLSAGSPVTVLDESGSWLQIACRSDTGFVPQAYVTRNAEAGPFPSSGTVRASGRVYLRVGTSNSSYTIVALAGGDAVTVVGSRGSWYMVSTGEVTGWIQKAYILLGDAVVVEGLTVHTVLDDLLTTFQPNGRWAAGDAAVGAPLGYVFEQENLLEAVLRIPNSLVGTYGWTIDQSKLPWRLGLAPLSDTPACELRLHRNMTGLRVMVDRTDLCTVLAPVGKDGLTIEGVNGGSDRLVSSGAATWGKVERLYRDAQEDDPAALKAAAQSALARQSAPLVTVEADALALHAATGEPLDKLIPGALCRLPLPDMQEVLEERIVALHWEDVLHAPEQVRVTMANRLQSAASLLAGVDKRYSIR